MRYYSDISNDDEYDSVLFLSNECHGTTCTSIPTPWRRLRLALGQCWQRHNSCWTHVVTNHHQGNNERDNSLLHERNDKTNTSAASSPCSSSSSSTQTMNKDGMFFMASLPNLPKRRISRNNATPARKKTRGSSWKLQRRLLSSLPKSSLRPILLPHEDEVDGEESVLRHSKTTTKYENHPLWIDNFWPSSTLKSTVQPRSVSACDHVLTVGSASAVECIRMPPEPSLGSIHQHGPDSCASSLSSASSQARSKKVSLATTAMMSRRDASVLVSNKIKTASNASSRVFQNDQDDEDSAHRNSTSKLYPVSLTRDLNATKDRRPLTTNKNQNNRKGQPIKTEHGDSDDDNDDHNDEASAGGGSYSVPTLTVSYEDDVAQLAVTFSASFRDETDDEEEDDEEPLFVSQTIGLHNFTLGATFSHPAATVDKPKKSTNPLQSKKPAQHQSSVLLAPPPPLSRSSSVDSTSSSVQSMSEAFQKPKGRNIGIAFAHPWYSSKLLQLPKRDNPKQWPLQQQQNNPSSKYSGNSDVHRNTHTHCTPHQETSHIDERDDRDVWSLVESDPMDGDMTDPPTPVPIKRSKVWSPDSLGWSSSEDDEREDNVGRFETSTKGSSSWKWPNPSGQAFIGARDEAPSSSSRLWEELPEEGDGFTVRRPTRYSTRFESRRLQEQALHLKRNQPTNAVYLPRSSHPLRPLFMNS